MYFSSLKFIDIYKMVLLISAKLYIFSIIALSYKNKPRFISHLYEALYIYLNSKMCFWL